MAHLFLFQIIEIKIQVGISEHDLESQGIWFGTICYEPRGSGVKEVLLLMHHLLGVAVKREN